MRWMFTLPLLLLSTTLMAQTQWPITVTTRNGTLLKIYEWQTESFENQQLNARAAISIKEKGNEEPVFGAVWIRAELERNKDQYLVRNIRILQSKLPEGQSLGEDLQLSLENELAEKRIQFSREQMDNALKLGQQQDNLSSGLNTTPPEIIYSRQPAILVYIDGSPRMEYNQDWGLETVINSPFTIVKNNDGQFYLYGGKHWYRAASATGPFAHVSAVPQNLRKIESSLEEAYRKNNGAEEKTDYIISAVIVRTTPAELLQTNGDAEFSSIEGTALLYVRNTDNDIFLDVNSQQYYVLLAGRWYKARSLSGQWQYVGADRLPADFSRIPEQSEKSDVLASVAGTVAARNALEEAEVPQTARVDRNSAKLDVIYDGDPEFERIDGTSLEYALNAPVSVIRYRNRYYAVDNGVWFEARSARGPWWVATVRPFEVALIPPRYPVYHIKYVYIYDVYPNYVYMGYTPGYLNTLIYGPTIVYGTGYYYRPWHRRYYYPRPCTWGYNMRYSAWTGWGFGNSFNYGWFSNGFGRSYWSYSRTGWWGPCNYRPNYCERNYGWNNRYSGYGNRYTVNYNYINYNNNIYNRRRDVNTRDNPRYTENRRNNWAYNGNGNNNGYRRNDDYNNRNGNNFNGNNRPSRNYDPPADNRNRNGNNGNNNGNNRGNNNNYNNGRPDWQNPTRENNRDNNRRENADDNRNNGNNNGGNNGNRNNGRPDWQNPTRENNRDNNRPPSDNGRNNNPPPNPVNRNFERPDWQPLPPQRERNEGRSPERRDNNRPPERVENNTPPPPPPAREYRPANQAPVRETPPPSNNNGGGQRPPERNNSGGQENRRPGRG